MLVQIVALGVGLGGEGGVEEAVVIRVRPVRVVVAAVGLPDLEEHVRVEVVGDPAAALQHEVFRLLHVDVDLPLLVAELDVHAEVFAPHLLDGLGDGAVVLRGVVNEFDGRAALAAGVAGLGEEALGVGEGAGEAGPGSVAGIAGIADGVGGLLVAPGDVANDGFAVDREGEGLADALVVEGRAGRVAAVKIDAEVGVDLERLGVVAAVRVDLGVGQLVGHVHLPGAEHALVGGEVLGRVEMDRVELHRRGVPVVRVADDGDELVGFPRLEDERAAADEVAGLGPGQALAVERAVFRDDVRRHGPPRIVAGHDLEQVGRGVVERDDESAGVGGLETDLREVGEPALIVVAGAGDEVVHEVGVLGGERGREDAAKGLDDLAGGDRVAVGPPEVGAKRKGIDEAIGGDRPRLGEAGHGAEVLRVLGHEALEQGHDDLVLGHAGDSLRVEVLHLGAVAHPEDHRLFGRGAVGGRLACELIGPATAGETDDQTERKAAGEGGGTHRGGTVRGNGGAASSRVSLRNSERRTPNVER